MCVNVVSFRLMEVGMRRHWARQIIIAALLMIDTVAAADTVGVMELALGAGEERGALGHHFRGEGELLAVKDEHVAVFNEVFLAISALTQC